MQNFIYQSPTRIVFGKDQLQQLPTMLKEAEVSSLLLVYGRESIKRLGIYDRIKEITDELGIALCEESGVRPNPELKSVKSGRRKIIEHGVDFILAAGGGSVIDAAKAMAFAAFKPEEEIWRVYQRRLDINRAIPLGVVLTLSATGSETNGNTVLSNDVLEEKRSIKHDALVPRFAIIDPDYTRTVPTHHTIAGSVDILMHLFEQFFSPTPRTETGDYLLLGVMQSVLENTDRYLEGDNSYETRANLSWAATLALNWILQQGRQGDWASHKLVYPPSAKYDLTHGFSLSAMQPVWMRMALEANPGAMGPRLKQLGRRLFGVHTPEATIEAIVERFDAWGAPVKLSDLGVTLSEAECERFASQVTDTGGLGHMFRLGFNEALEFYRRQE